jgi:site-specific DNA-methyltransferase (adenine-specific)
MTRNRWPNAQTVTAVSSASHLDGHTRALLPRFTALNGKEREQIEVYFQEWVTLALRVLYPGGHLFLASNVFLSQTVFAALVRAGLEFRGQVIRLVRTLWGGDKPKNAEEEFPDVCSMPRGCYEPWGIFRKLLPRGMTVSECLRQFQTGGLRRKPDGNPFEDVIESERTPRKERMLASHPSLKPQSFLRQLVYASLPLGEGILLYGFKLHDCDCRGGWIFYPWYREKSGLLLQQVAK